jgi:uncharacterized membrane protein
MLEKFKEFLSIFIGTMIVLISSFMVSYYFYNDVSILSMILVILGVLILYPAYEYWNTEISNFLNKKNK